MAIISGVTVDWSLSPRVIYIPEPVEEVTIEDLQDTLLDIEDSEEGITFSKLRNTSGGEDLGGSVKVGWTMQLTNAQLAFEARTTPDSSGQATSSNSGITLTDSSANFITEGILTGATVVNFTDMSVACVSKVMSQTQLKHQQLEGGTNNDWTIGDYYRVYNEIQCDILGGNLVAVDTSGNSISPILATAFTQILKTSSSSATLQELTSIQHSSFSGGVTVDTSSVYTGTGFPVGTSQKPVNNLIDAKAIAVERGFNTFYILGDITIDGITSYEGYSFVGDSQNKSTITINSSANVLDCEFYDSTITGTLDGNSVLKYCKTLNLNYINGQIENCTLGDGTITLSGAGDAHFLDCKSGIAGTGIPVIDMGGSGSNLGVRNYNGGLKIINKTGTDSVSVDLNSGRIVLDSTITNGTITVRGIGELQDDSTGSVLVISHYLTNPFSVRGAILNLIESLRPHHTGQGNIFYWDPVNGNDSWDGISRKTAVYTFAQAHNLATDYGHDIIYLVPSATGVFYITENIQITKNWLFLRGPGYNARFRPTTVLASKAAMEVNAEGIEISGFHLDLVNCTDSDCIGIKKTGKYFHLKNVIVKNTAKQGILSINGHDEIMEDFTVAYCGTDGIEITNTVGNEAEDIIIKDGHIDICGGNGINLSGTAIHEVILKKGLLLHGSGQYGFKIGTGAEETHIYPDVLFRDNVLGEILDNGVSTFDNRYIGKIDDLHNNMVEKSKILTVSKFLGLK